MSIERCYQGGKHDSQPMSFLAISCARLVLQHCVFLRAMCFRPNIAYSSLPAAWWHTCLLTDNLSL